ncbi:hypothetical protein bcgnr5382_51480 [Bacillus cereus]
MREMKKNLLSEYEKEVLTGAALFVVAYTFGLLTGLFIKD